VDDDNEDRSALRIRLIWLVVVVLTVIVIAADFTYLHFRGTSSAGPAHHVSSELHTPHH